MNIIKVSATKARNNFFELLNQVVLGKQIIIERDNKEIALLSPKIKQIDWKKFRQAAEKARGILKGKDDYKTEKNPLRRKGAADFLGKWDKGWNEDK